ncbi:hypothetical protein PV402_39775 [Streptomyces scabiei]|uniref:hypothetical protein n=1 Tax=Streptomyces scabiei TaxID=1930 RepID=UPI0029B38562|nr:hypothetical protein [Streptomyces scabiei]MDX2658328.1 hypothetical protein [Streptomyces scabiei]MDX2870485.1 hypothetical protein [Streptomyces scabiei]
MTAVPEPAVLDEVLAGRAAESGRLLAGLILAAELDTAGAPRKLPADLFPDVDPVVVQAVWDRALVVGIRAAQFLAAPRFHRDRLARLQGELEAAAFAAMGSMVAGARSAVACQAVLWEDDGGEVGGRDGGV